MKLKRRAGSDFGLELSAMEKHFLCDLLLLYPLIPASHHRQRTKLTSPEAAAPDADLIEEALREQRAQNREQVQAMLSEKGRFRKVGAGYSLQLARPQIEWLLQVLNDIRVGSWILLGEPDEMKGKKPVLNEQNSYYLWVMDLAACFEAALLEALNNPDAQHNDAGGGTKRKI